MRAKGHDGCRASSADTANGLARLLGVGFVVAAGFCGIVRAVAIGIGFAALVLFLVKQLAEFGIPIDGHAIGVAKGLRCRVGYVGISGRRIFRACRRSDVLRLRGVAIVIIRQLR